jgi:DNA-binding Xre family transcriptional regulator
MLAMVVVVVLVMTRAKNIKLVILLRLCTL